MDNFDNDFNNYERQPNHEINARYGRPYKEYRGLRDDDTEFSTDFLTSDVTTDTSSTGSALVAGAAGMIASIAALFTAPFLLGIVGIALGFFAAAKGNKVLGYLTIGVGLLAAVIPLFYTGPFISLF